jgi:hypothetical protein
LLPGVVGLPARIYYPAIKKETVDLVMSADVETEAQVVALLGEPTERSQTRHFTKRHGQFEQYDLAWFKAPGQPIVKVTFLNGRKTTVLSGVG